MLDGARRRRGDSRWRPRTRAQLDLLLTDVVVPGESGRELAVRLRAAPGLRALYMSGYTGDIIARHGVLEPGMRLLEKPFDPVTLGRAVRAALDAPAGA